VKGEGRRKWNRLKHIVIAYSRIKSALLSIIRFASRSGESISMRDRRYAGRRQAKRQVTYRYRCRGSASKSSARNHEIFIGRQSITPAYVPKGRASYRFAHGCACREIAERRGALSTSRAHVTMPFRHRYGTSRTVACFAAIPPAESELIDHERTTSAGRSTA